MDAYKLRTKPSIVTLSNTETSHRAREAEEVPQEFGGTESGHMPRLCPCLVKISCTKRVHTNNVATSEERVKERDIPEFHTQLWNTALRLIQDRLSVEELILASNTYLACDSTPGSLPNSPTPCHVYLSEIVSLARLQGRARNSARFSLLARTLQHQSD